MKEPVSSSLQSGYFVQSKPRKVKIYSLSIRYISVTMRILCLQHVVLVIPISQASAVSVVRHKQGGSARAKGDYKRLWSNALLQVFGRGYRSGPLCGANHDEISVMAFVRSES